MNKGVGERYGECWDVVCVVVWVNIAMYLKWVFVGEISWNGRMKGILYIMHGSLATSLWLRL